MRLLFSGVPAYGHLLPLLPFVRAAQDQQHDVAIITAAVMQDAMKQEVPTAAFLPAGPSPEEIVKEVRRHRPGADPINAPDPESVADFFAGARIDLAFDDTLAQAQKWHPDLLVVDAADFVGPIIASALGIPYAMVAFGPELPGEFSKPMIAVAATRYAEHDLITQPPLAIIDPAPASLQAPGWVPSPLHMAYRAAPYQRTSQATSVKTARRPSVLVSLGTVFNDRDLLRDIITQVAEMDVDVTATLGLQISDAPATAPNVHYETFMPLAELLPGTDVVISAGGAGTVLAAASQGIPMVLLPQGADQPINAERARAAGVALIATPETVGSAVSTILSTPVFRDAAHRVQREVATRLSAPDIITRLAAAVTRASAQDHDAPRHP